MIMESDYYGNTPLSHLAQATITLIVLGSAVLAIIAILLIWRHKKEDEKMEQERNFLSTRMPTQMPYGSMASNRSRHCLDGRMDFQPVSSPAAKAMAFFPHTKSYFRPFPAFPITYFPASV